MDPMPPAEELVARVREIALALPETREEEAWRGTRWRVRQATIAHLITVLPDRPSAYAEATGHPGPATVLTFRSTGDELLALTNAGMSREEAYRIVQGQAMKVWAGEGTFMSLLQADPAVQKTLKPPQLKAVFDYGRYVKHAGAIIKRTLKVK